MAWSAPERRPHQILFHFFILLLVLNVVLAWLFTPDHVLVIVQLLPEAMRLFGWVVHFALAYLGARIHHIFIIVTFWCFEIVKWQNLDWPFVGSKMVDLLLVNELFIVAHVVEDAGDAHELEFRFDSC